MGEDTAFDALVRELDYPMFVVTAAAGDEVDGCLVGFATQCSISPPRFLACLSKQNRTTELAVTARSLVVHVLHEDDRELAARFGTLTGHQVEKLAGCEWTPGPDGGPVLAGLDWFAGRIIARHDVGDHVAYVLDVTSEGTATPAGRRALGYQATRDFEPGHPA